MMRTTIKGEKKNATEGLKKKMEEDRKEGEVASLGLILIFGDRFHFVVTARPCFQFIFLFPSP